MVQLLYKKMVDSSRLTVILSGRSESVVIYALAVVIYALVLRFRFKSCCSIAILRNVEPQESAE